MVIGQTVFCIIFLYKVVCCDCFLAPVLKHRKVGRPKKKKLKTKAMKAKDMRMAAPVPGRRRGRPRKVWNGTCDSSFVA